MLISSKHLYVYDLSILTNIIKNKINTKLDINLYLEELIMDLLINDLGYIFTNYVPCSLFKHIDSVNYKMLKDNIYEMMIDGYRDIATSQTYTINIVVYDSGIVRIYMDVNLKDSNDKHDTRHR